MTGRLETVAEFLRERIDLEGGRVVVNLTVGAPPDRRDTVPPCRSGSGSYFWTLPNTLIGLVLGVFTFQIPGSITGWSSSIVLPGGSRPCCHVSVVPR